jgi:hypothetical protein
LLLVAPQASSAVIVRGCSSVGRAPVLQAGGRRFDPDQLHQRIESLVKSGLRLKITVH